MTPSERLLAARCVSRSAHRLVDLLPANVVTTLAGIERKRFKLKTELHQLDCDVTEQVMTGFKNPYAASSTSAPQVHI